MTNLNLLFVPFSFGNSCFFYSPICYFLRHLFINFLYIRFFQLPLISLNDLTVIDNFISSNSCYFRLCVELFISTHIFDVFLILSVSDDIFLNPNVLNFI